MEILFENKYTLSRWDVIQYTRRARNKWFFRIGVLVIALGIAFLADGATNTGEFSPWAFPLIFVGALLCLAYLPIGWLTYEQMLDTSGRMPRTTVQFTEKGFTHRHDGEVEEYSYDNITRFSDTGAYLILMVGPMKGIMVHKHGFKGGTFAKFTIFIQKKVS